jgi:tellurite methyltransferase
MAKSSAQRSWSNFYQANAGRSPRPLFVEALAALPDQLGTAPTRWAADVGCGDGTETLALLQERWHVLAIDQQPEAISLVKRKVPPELQQQLHTQVTSFEDLHLPSVHFVYAGFSLPFCVPQHFATLWTTLVTALHPGGFFAGQFFGVRDSWATNSAMTFHKRSDVQALLEPFEITVLREEEKDGEAVSGPKHWHVFHVIAHKR